MNCATRSLAVTSQRRHGVAFDELRGAVHLPVEVGFAEILRPRRPRACCVADQADLNAGLISDEQARAPRPRSPARPTSTAPWTAPPSSSKATPWPP